MKIKDFYTLRSKLSSQTIQAHPIAIKSNDGKIGDAEKLLLGEYSGIDQPVYFRQEYGTQLADILDTGTATMYLISEKMKLVLEKQEFSGWTTYNVKIFDKEGDEIPSYYGLSITGRCGPIDYSKCEILQKRLVLNGPLNQYFKGLYVGLDNWDGSDFFLPQDYYGIIVSKEVKKALEASGLTNMSFQNLDVIETPEYALT